MAHLLFKGRLPQTDGQPGQHVMRNPAVNPERSLTPAGSDAVGSGSSSHGGEITLRKRIRAVFRRIFKPNSNRSESSAPDKTSSTSPPSKTSQEPQANPVEGVNLGSARNAADTQLGPEGSEGGGVVPQPRSVQAHRSKKTTAHEGSPRQEACVSFPQDPRLRATSRAPTLGEGTQRPSGETPAHPVAPADDPKVPAAPNKTEPEPRPFHRRRPQSIFKGIDCGLGAYFRLGSYALSSLRRLKSLPEMRLTQPYEVPLRKRFSLTELREGLLSTNGQRSAALNALDYTGRLSHRTSPQGGGAFSDVSQARLDENRLVAVKALRTTNIEGIDEIRMRKRLGREIYVWAGLHHPHVLEFLGFAFEDKTPCLISPWCDNGNLQTYLQRYKGADRRRLVREIAEGLRYLHVQIPPIFHGDFKTANVLVTDKHVARICDFGVSKRVGQVNTGFTTIGTVSGTIRYSAPEILLNGKPQTLESDVYSFACVALETMTGKCPFWGLDVYQIVVKAVSKETPSSDDHSELKDQNLWDLLQCCWNHEPSQRPTMTAVCRKLVAAGYGPSTPFYITN